MILNLFGQPGAGKSTTRAKVFSMLKESGVNCEEVYEHAKKLTWSSRTREMACQPYIFGKQLRDLEILQGQVDVIITDSPLLLSYFYGQKYCGTRYASSFYDFVLDQFIGMGGMNYFIRRVKPYNPKGRNQSEGESDEIGVELLALLDHVGVPYKIIDGDSSAAAQIAADVLDQLRKAA